MKTKISLVTLFACAAAGTSFAADTVVAYSQSSGTKTLSENTVYSGNTAENWGKNMKSVGETYLADAYKSDGGYDFTWVAARKAFFLEAGDDDDYDEYYEAFDTIFSLTGSANFVNNAEIEFTSVAGVIGETEDDDNVWNVLNTNLILFADSAKFTNAGNVDFCLEEIGYPCGFKMFVLGNAVFENKGSIIGCDSGAEIMILENAQFINSGKVNVSYLYGSGNSKIINNGEVYAPYTYNKCCVDLSTNATFENSGGVVKASFWIEGNATVLNNKGGTITAPSCEFDLDSGNSADLASIKNSGTFFVGTVYFLFDGIDTVPSAEFVNYGSVASASDDSFSVYIDFNRGIDNSWSKSTIQNRISATNLAFKNYGNISCDVEIDTGVKVTLAQGSNISGSLSLGNAVYSFGSNGENYYGGVLIHLKKDVLNIELTGTGTAALVSGDLILNNTVEFGVAFADDAAQLLKYEIQVWTDDLSEDGGGFVESSLSGTLSKFGTTFKWALDTETGVLTVEDVNLDEEYTIDSNTQTVALTSKDTATFDASLSSYSGTISGSGGNVYSGNNLVFGGSLKDFSGTFVVTAGTLTVADNADLGSAKFSVAGTLRFGGDCERTVQNEISGNGTVVLASGASAKFTKSLGVKTLAVNEGAALVGGVTMTHENAELVLAGTLVLNADAGEKLSLGGGTLKIESTAKLDLYGKNGGRETNLGASLATASAEIESLQNSKRVVIAENATVSGNVVDFLATDAQLASLAANYTVLYFTDGGLSVQALTNAAGIAASVDKSDLSASFIDWALADVETAISSLGTGFTAASSSLESDDPLASALLAGNAGTARSILDRLSPKSFAAMIAMPVEAFHTDAHSISARLEERRFNPGGDWEFFAQAQTISVDNDTATDAPTFDFDSCGALAGADCRVGETSVLGIAVAAGTSEAKIRHGGGKIESDDIRAMLYFGTAFAENFYVNAGAQVGFASYDVKRSTDYGRAKGDTDGWNAGAFVEAGAEFALLGAESISATPYIRLAYVHASTDSFSESGCDKAFDADSLSGDSLRARIGCGFSWKFDVAGTAWRAGLDVAYSRELLDDEIDVDVSSASRAISETAGLYSEDVFSVGPTLSVALGSGVSVYGAYSFNAGTDSATAHAANLGVKMSF